MVVLLRKYEMIDNESFDLEDLENDFELESLFDSDFDFELLEFDFEEFIIKVFYRFFKLLDKLEDGLQSESFDYFILSSFEGDEDF